jgi:hypothetical protein
MEAFMPRDVKRPAEAESRPSSFSSLLLGWTQQGIDSFLATQRILADFATRRSTGMLESLREGASDSKNSPIAILTELAVEGTANLTEAQRVLLNLVEQENGIVMGGVIERVGGSAAAVTLAKRLRRGIDTLVEMQQEFLTIAGKHAQERLKKGTAIDGACLVDAARESMDNLVKAQKKLMDIVVQEEPKSKGRESDEGKKTEVFELVREAAASFIDAQKSLLDLAGQEVNVNLQAVTRAAEMAKVLQVNPFPAISGDGLKDFVAAEKEVFDSFLKPKGAGKGQAKAKSNAQRPSGRRRTMAAEAVSGA